VVVQLGGILEWNVIGAPRTWTGVSRNRICTEYSNGALITSVPWGSPSASIGEERGAGSSSPRLRNSHPKMS